MTIEPVTNIHLRVKLEVSVHSGWHLSSSEMIGSSMCTADGYRVTQIQEKGWGYKSQDAWFLQLKKKKKERNGYQWSSSEIYLKKLMCYIIEGN